MPTSWPAAPTPLSIEPGWAHVFRLRLNLPGETLSALRSVLDPAEQARAARYRVEGKRREYVAARGQMRSVLAAYVGCNPAGLHFDASPHGKPFLPGAGLRFNLSHTDGLALLAVTNGQEVGIDLESTHRQVEGDTLAERFFSPSEVEALRALPPEQHLTGFLNGWTRKEAYIKARGLGLALPLDSFSVTLKPGAPARLTAPDPGWVLYPLDPGPGYIAALVVEGALSGIRCWSWGAAPEPEN